MLDPTRPCDSRSRKPNRYTKDELIGMVSVLPNPPPNFRKMTINDLCALLRIAPHPTVPLIPAMKLKLKTPPTTPPPPTSDPGVNCVLDPYRPCDSKSKNPNRYKRDELANLWKSHCKPFKKLKKQPTKIDEYCKAINNFRRPVTENNIFEVTPAKKEAIQKIGKLFKKLKTKEKVKVVFPKNRCVTIDKYNINLKNWAIHLPSPQLLNFLKSFEKNTLKLKSYKIYLKTECENYPFRFRPNDHPKDPTVLFNRNVASTFLPEFTQWVELQQRYIFNLSWQDKMIVLLYTYAGDKILNQYLLNNIDPFSIIPTYTCGAYSSYSTHRIFPLAFILYQQIQQHPTVDQFIQSIIPNPQLLNDLRNLYLISFGQPFSKRYYDIFTFFVRKRNVCDIHFIRPLIESFHAQLSRIIGHAPKTTFQFWVYRGIKAKDFVIIGDAKQYVFTNRLFMSTSFDLCRAFEFKTADTPCCLQQILVTKGLSCLLVSCLSFFNKENEILFLPGRHLYPLGNDFIASNIDVDTRKFVLTN
jgi:hypothetical protein